LHSAVQLLSASRDSESGLVHWSCPSVCPSLRLSVSLSICLSRQNAKKSNFLKN